MATTNVLSAEQIVMVVILLITLPTHADSQVQCGRQLIRSGRIVGGDDAYDGEFPWMVSITLYGRHFCGGTVVARRWVLTAGHCVQRFAPSAYMARAGDYVMSKVEIGHHPVTFAVEKVFLHPNYSTPVRYFNDIALLRLKSDITYSNYVQPICLPRVNASYTRSHKGVVAGWGYLKESAEGGRPSDVLQKVTLPIYNYTECEEWYHEGGKNVRFQYSQMCAGYKDGGKDSCQGDSGGPLMVKESERFVQIGIVSAGIGCAQPLLPGLYTRIEDFMPWIRGFIDVS